MQGKNSNKELIKIVMLGEGMTAFPLFKTLIY